MSPKRGKKPDDLDLDELYRVLRESDYRKVLELGQQQLGSSSDKLAVLEAMIDAIENMLYDGEVEQTAPLKALEASLRDERERLTVGGAKSDRYKKFLDATYEGEGE